MVGALSDDRSIIDSPQTILATTIANKGALETSSTSWTVPSSAIDIGLVSIDNAILTMRWGACEGRIQTNTILATVAGDQTVHTVRTPVTGGAAAIYIGLVDVFHLIGTMGWDTYKLVALKAV